MFILVALAAGAYFVSAKAFASEAKFSVGKIKFNNSQSLKTGYTQLFFDIEAVISNPIKFNLTVDAIYAQIFYLNKHIATIERKEPFSINPESKVKILCDVKVSTLDVLKSVAEIKNIQGIELQIKGIAEHTSGRLTINETIKVS